MSRLRRRTHGHVKEEQYSVWTESAKYVLQIFLRSYNTETECKEFHVLGGMRWWWVDPGPRVISDCQLWTDVDRQSGFRSKGHLLSVVQSNNNLLYNMYSIRLQIFKYCHAMSTNIEIFTHSTPQGHNNCSKQLQHDQCNSWNARTGGNHSFSLSPSPFLFEISAQFICLKDNNSVHQA